MVDNTPSGVMVARRGDEYKDKETRISPKLRLPTPVDFDICICYSIFVEAMNRALRMVA